MSEKMLSDRLRPNIECAPWVIDEVKRLEAALRTHENGGQESEAGAFAWLHEIVEPDGYKTGMFSFKPDNPWSHWTESHKEKCQYTKAPLFLAPPSATAIETAAIMRAAEVLREMTRDDYNAQWNNTVKHCADVVSALIPQDGRTALEELLRKEKEQFGRKVAFAIYEQHDKLRKDETFDGLRAIVNNLIGVPPLSSETVSGEGK